MGEQGLPYNGSCLLGSLLLPKFIRNPFKSDASFDWDKFKNVVKVFTRLLDSVVEKANLPLKAQQEEILLKRRHGMGITGLASALTMLGIKYGSKESKDFLKLVMKEITITGLEENIKLATQLGPAPIFNDIENRTKYVNTFYFNDLMKNIEYSEETIALIKNSIIEKGLRFTHHTSIAPTGSISIAYGNNCSGGIEPTFSHSYVRNIITPGRNTKVSEDVESYEYMLYKSIFGPTKIEDLPDYFITAKDIHPVAHIEMQAVAQEFCDSSISKTINVDTNFPFEEFKDIYKKAYELKCKGTTTYRYNPEIFSGVLVEKDDLSKTTYEFTTDTGKTYKCLGSDILMYRGEEVMAATLYDALKEGYYGRDK